MLTVNKQAPLPGTVLYVFYPTTSSKLIIHEYNQSRIHSWIKSVPHPFLNKISPKKKINTDTVHTHILQV